MAVEKNVKKKKKGRLIFIFLSAICLDYYAFSHTKRTWCSFNLIKVFIFIDIKFYMFGIHGVFFILLTPCHLPSFLLPSLSSLPHI